MTSNNPPSNVLPLLSKSVGEKGKREGDALWADIGRARKSLKTLYAGIDEITPGVFNAIKRDIEDGKISGHTATIILNNLHNIAIKTESLNLAKYKELINSGVPIGEDSDVKDKNALILPRKEKKLFQKAAETTLVELLRLKQLKKQGADA